ncbi:MAG: glycosyltransferase [Muribaculum sp.]|nr:glycosyltransferase [Muribaculum sp.]
MLINKSDSTGGAAIVTRRLMEALRGEGVDARMLVAENLVKSPFIAAAAGSFRLKVPFLEERLKIFLKNGFNRRTLFKVDTASDGVDISMHPWVKEADIICINWINQGLLSLKDIKILLEKGKKIVWTMHDMWPFTAICHHAGECSAYMLIDKCTGPAYIEKSQDCRNCPLFGRHASPVYKKKKDLYATGKMHFVAVSHWLADKARSSALLYDQPLHVIPNPFPIKDSINHEVRKDNAPEEIKLLFGAARLDDPIKGLPVLIGALHWIKKYHPDIARQITLTTFGAVKDSDSIREIPVKTIHTGMIRGEENIRDLYTDSDILVSTSLYETLPGTLVEAQAYGAIPVSFNRGGQPDIVEDGKTGFLADLSSDFNESVQSIGEALLRSIKVATDPKARRTMQNAMLENVRTKFEASVVAKKYIRLFDSLK